MIKLSKTQNWRKGKDVTAGEYASNWTVGFEVVETPISDGDHAETEDAEIEEGCDVYRAEDELQEDLPGRSYVEPDDDNLDNDDWF